MPIVELSNETVSLLTEFKEKFQFPFGTEEVKFTAAIPDDRAIRASLELANSYYSDPKRRKELSLKVWKETMDAANPEQRRAITKSMLGPDAEKNK